MKAPGPAVKVPLSLIFGSCGLLLALLSPGVAAQEDSAFLACGEIADRGQRIACLEDALEAATPEAEGPAAAVPAAPAPRTSTVTNTPAPAPAPTAPAQAAAPAAEAEDDPSLMDRLRNFGQRAQASISLDDEGQDQLHDTITALEKRRDMWVVTLSSGQVWIQEYPRALALRVGDAITITQGAGLGDGFRLSAERLSGFIRVKRMR